MWRRTIRKRNRSVDVRYVHRRRRAIVGRENVQPWWQDDGHKLRVALNAVWCMNVGGAKRHINGDASEDREVGQRETEAVAVLIACRVVLTLARPSHECPYHHWTVLYDALTFGRGVT